MSKLRSFVKRIPSENKNICDSYPVIWTKRDPYNFFSLYLYFIVPVKFLYASYLFHSPLFKFSRIKETYNFNVFPFYLHGNICTMTTLHFSPSHSPSHTDSLSFTCASAQTDKRRDTIANREPPCVECQLRTLCLDIAPKLGHLPIDICRFAAVGALPLQWLCS